MDKQTVCSHCRLHLEVNRVGRSAVQVVDGKGDGLRHSPLMPHLLPIVQVPH